MPLNPQDLDPAYKARLQDPIYKEMPIKRAGVKHKSTPLSQPADKDLGPMGARKKWKPKGRR